MDEEFVLPLEAIDLLRAGDQRFREGARGSRVRPGRARSVDLAAEGQRPFAVVLGCSDSRVPVEIVFDQGVGDLFVIRVAGNIVASSQLGSVEFAALRFSTRLVVVLGHSDCGAVLATIDAVAKGEQSETDALRSIVDSVKPAVEPLVRGPLGADREALAREAVRANVEASCDRLRRGSPLLERLETDRRLAIVGAQYCISTGLVEFFHLPPWLA